MTTKIIVKRLERVKLAMWSLMRRIAFAFLALLGISFLMAVANLASSNSVCWFALMFIPLLFFLASVRALLGAVQACVPNEGTSKLWALGSFITNAVFFAAFLGGAVGMALEVWSIRQKFWNL